MKPSKYYAVARGRIPGIYFNWDDCRQQTDHFENAKFKSFTDPKEALEYINSNYKYELKKKRKPITVETDGLFEYPFSIPTDPLPF